MDSFFFFFFGFLTPSDWVLTFVTSNDFLQQNCRELYIENSIENCIENYIENCILKHMTLSYRWNKYISPFFKKTHPYTILYFLFIVIGFSLSGEANKIYFPFQSPLNHHIKEKKRGSNYEWSLVALFSLLLVLHTHIPFSIFHFQGTRTFSVNMILHWVAYTMENMQLF